MTPLDFNPVILLCLSLPAAVAVGHLIGLARRSSAARYDVRDAAELRGRQRRRR